MTRRSPTASAIALTFLLGADVACAQPPQQDSPQPVFENGALTVPGAAANGDTVPAKWSAQNDADDHVPTSGYALKHLTAEQRKAILASLRRAQGPTGPVA